MKVKVIGSGEKGFGEEKIKIFTKPKTKEERLSRAFSTVLSSMFLEYERIFLKNIFRQSVNSDLLIEKYVKILLREIKTRVYLGD